MGVNLQDLYFGDEEEEDDAPNTVAPPSPPAATSSSSTRYISGPVLSIYHTGKYEVDPADPDNPKPVLRFVPKKDRERLQREFDAKKDEEKRRKEAELRAEQEAREKRREERDRKARERGEEPDAATNGATNGAANGARKHRRDDEAGALPALDEATAAQQRERYLGPDLSKSTFKARKKRRRGGQEFKFDWDLEDDTRNMADVKAQQERDRPFLDQLTGPKLPFIEPEEIQREIEKRKVADAIRREDPVNGEARAQQVMEDYYKGRAQRMKIYTRMKHWSEKSLEDMQESDWRIFKENHGISTKGSNLPNPIRSWRESPLPSRLLDIVEAVGYREPTPIQRAAIPIALQGRDLLGVAVTGSGKTAAFLLPLLVYIQDLPPLDEINKNDGPYGLILAPTRELAQQIESEARKFAKPYGYTVVSIVGGHSFEEQTAALRNGAEIIVATPGRLVDCIERRLLVLQQCGYVILDEADRMVDLGFEVPLNKILDAMPASNEKPEEEDEAGAGALAAANGYGRNGLGHPRRYRETMMYTATMSPRVEKIAKGYLRNPAMVTIGNDGEAVDTVEQRVEFIGSEDKRKERLVQILQSGHFRPPIIVFVNIRRNCDMVARDVRAAGCKPVVLQGGRTQEQREAALAELRAGKADVLVATDVAARGIDVPDVSLVVNFNMATSIEQYMHRVGRTGRAGKSGVAITFLGNEDTDVLYDLRQTISKSAISKVPDELRRHEAAQQKPRKSAKHDFGGGGGGGGGGGAWIT